MTGDPAVLDKELEKDLRQAIYTLKTGFFLESLRSRENQIEIECFIDLFENEKKSGEDLRRLSRAAKRRGNAG